MSELAKALQEIKVDAPPTCRRTYRPDDEDQAAIIRLHEDGMLWSEIQQIVDRKLGLTDAITTRGFADHWARRCACWRTR